MHTSGIDQQCGHAHCKACVPGGTSAATCIHVQYKVCLAHSEKDKCTDTDLVFSGYSRKGIVTINGHTVNVVRKYFLWHQILNFSRRTLLFLEFFLYWHTESRSNWKWLRSPHSTSRWSICKYNLVSVSIWVYMSNHLVFVNNGLKAHVGGLQTGTGLCW